MKKIWPFSYYFLNFAAFSALLPFFVIFYQQLGFNGTEIGLLTGIPPLITLFAASRAEDIPPTYEALVEPPLTIRTKDGGVDPEYSAIRLSFGFPPGNVA